MKPTNYTPKSPLLEAAETYVMHLKVGDTIDDAQDECIVGKFRRLIPLLLRIRGLDVDMSEPGVWTVIERFEGPRLVFNDTGAARGDRGNFVVSNRTVRA